MGVYTYHVLNEESDRPYCRRWLLRREDRIVTLLAVGAARVRVERGGVPGLLDDLCQRCSDRLDQEDHNWGHDTFVRAADEDEARREEWVASLDRAQPRP